MKKVGIIVLVASAILVQFTSCSKCYKCDFEGEFSVDKVGFHCPQCDNREEGTMSVIRRVSGYLSAPNSRPFNTGKQQEVIQRIKHGS